MRAFRISTLAALVTWGGWAQSFESLVAQGVERQQTGDYAGAAEAYLGALKLKPDDVATHVNLGVVLVNLGRFDEGIAQYEAAEKLLPGDARILLNSALAYEKSGRLKEAKERFAALHAASPQDRKVIMLLADCELQLGEDQRVIELLQPGERDAAEDLAWSYMLGMALLRRGRPDEAQVLLDRILKNGDTAEARFLLGTRMFESGDYPAAVKQLASAAELNPHLTQLQSLYGRALLNTGDPQAASEAFRKELSTNPNDYQANLGLAQIDIARKQFGGALQPAELALRGRPDSPEAKLAVAECLAGTHQFKEALPHAEGATVNMPEAVEAHETLATIYSGLHRRAEAALERQRAETLAAALDPGPRVNEQAPQFQLGDVNLRGLHADRPTVLVFGSYSCPNFRDSAEALKALYRKYRSQVSFLLVYIREAHANGSWQSSRNVRQQVTLEPASSLSEKQQHAAMCTRQLHLPFTTAVDGMDGAVEKAYQAWPSRVFIVGEDGRVLYRSRLTDQEFRPEELETVLKSAMR